MQFNPSAGGVLIPSTKLIVGGYFEGEHIRRGKVIDRWRVHNLVVSEGLDYLLNAGLQGATQLTNWYMGVYKTNATPIAGWTAATITSLSTESTAYVSATRPIWTPVASSARLITNAAAPANFVANASETWYGGFVISSSTKSGTAGKLWAAALFNTAKVMDNLDQVNLTYGFGIASV